MTPSAAPSTPGAEQPQAAPKRQGRAKKARVEEPVTAIQKGREMGNQLLKKKADAGSLSLTLQSIPYAAELMKEMQNFSTEFESFGCIYMYR